MSAIAVPLRRQRAADLLARRRSRLERLRIDLAPDAATTLHVATYDLRAFTPRVVLLDRPAPLARWCAQRGVQDAIVGGFFLRPQYVPLGELRIADRRRRSVPFDPPWHALRACVQIEHGRPWLGPRQQLPDIPGGDVLQAGPLLVSGGRVAAGLTADVEGFSPGAHQFDSDITRGRYPRAALGVAGNRLLAVACDGRTATDAGMTLLELAQALVSLGVDSAINLDGGGSASLVYAGRLRNRPREEHGIDLLDGRPILTAIAIESR